MSLKKDIQNKLSVIFRNNYKIVGYSFLDIRRIKALKPNQVNSYPLFGKKVYFKDSFELLHSLSEIFIHEIYKIELPTNAYIIDCGANIGISALYFKRRFPDSTVLTFEPDKENFKILSLNTNSFNLNHVVLNNKAVWIENTTLNFSSDNSMSSKIDDDESSTSSKVQAIRLYDLIVRPIDLLKIDIEGAEFKVLMDIKSKLNFIKNMFFEYHGSFSQIHELTKIFNVLTESGFKFYIREATPVYKHPFMRTEKNILYDIQLNIFCFRE